MELSLSELKKRDVINIVDGRCLGRIIDMQFDFPEGVIVGIVVPGRCNRGIFRLFDKNRMYIDECNIVKIGGDVILVDIKCGGTCDKHVSVNSPGPGKGGHRPQKPDCPPQCPPPCPPNPCEPRKCGGDDNLFNSSRIDLNDY